MSRALIVAGALLVALLAFAPASHAQGEGEVVPGECADFADPEEQAACVRRSDACAQQFPDRLSEEFQNCLAGRTPLGGVDTGGGGTAESGPDGRLLGGGAALLAALVAGALLMRRRALE